MGFGMSTILAPISFNITAEGGRVCLLFYQCWNLVSFVVIYYSVSVLLEGFILYAFTLILLFRGVRPFGVSLLVAGWDEDDKKPFLFQCDPSGAYFPWKATAMGKNHVNGKTFLEKRYNEDLELEDAVHTAILTLKVKWWGIWLGDLTHRSILNKDQEGLVSRRPCLESTCF